MVAAAAASGVQTDDWVNLIPRGLRLITAIGYINFAVWRVWLPGDRIFFKRNLSLAEMKKKRSEESQTPRAGFSKAEPKKIRPAADPLPGDAGPGRPKFNQLEMVTIPLPTDPVWWRSMHAISCYHGNRPTNTHIHPQTNKQDRLQYTAPQISAHAV